MASIERTAYPRFRGSPTAQELQELFTPTEDEIASATGTVRSQDNLIRFLVLLKCFQYLNRFPTVTEVPPVIVEHIRACLRIADPVSSRYEQPRTLYRHQSAIRDYLAITPAQTRQARHLAAGVVLEAAQMMINPADLINTAVERLREENCEVPGFPTLNRLVQRIRTLVHRRMFGQLHQRLAAEKREALDELLSTTELSRRQSGFDDLKRTPKRPTLKHVLDAVDGVDQIRYRICEPEGLRAELLKLHGMAHTVIYGAEMTFD